MIILQAENQIKWLSTLWSTHVRVQVVAYFLMCKSKMEVCACVLEEKQFNLKELYRIKNY